MKRIVSFIRDSYWGIPIIILGVLMIYIGIFGVLLPLMVGEGALVGF